MLLVFLAVAPARALEPADWRYRQSLAVERAGLQKLALPPETLGLARPGLEDLRLLDPAGREVPFVFTAPAPEIPATTRAPESFRANLIGSTTELLIATGTATPLEALTLVSPAPGFLKAARLEVQRADGTWETVAESTALFRQYGAAQLRFPLERRVAAQLRVTVDDSRTRPVPFTGARLELAGATPPEVTLPLPVRLVRREEFAGESVLTLDLGGAQVALAALEFSSREPLFARTVTLAARELRDEGSAERTLGTAEIWRVAAEGVPASARLEAPLRCTTPARELLLHIANGDSPPLAIERVAARQYPRWLVFHAAEPGTYSLLTGHPQVAAPRYDLATLATALRDTPPGSLAPGRAEPNPGYREADPLAEAPLRGATLDPAPWGFRKQVQIATAGVQQLELDLEVLARAQAGLADVRLVRDGAQVPYLLERPALARSVALTATAAADPKRPRVSRWQLKLPRPGAPITRLTLASGTAVFQRHFRVVEQIADERRGETRERTLASADWSQTPGEKRPLALPLPAPPAADVIFLETDNGDNPPIELSSVRAEYRVARLLFKTDSGSAAPAAADGLALYYGNRRAAAPRYDLALIARQILAAEKAVARLGAEEPMRAGGWGGSWLEGLGAGWIFWGALALVVLGLLFVVAKLLPKPPAPGA